MSSDIFIFISMSQPAGLSQNNIRFIAEKDTQLLNPSLQQMHWVAAFIDRKYYLAHPLAIDRLQKLQHKVQAAKVSLQQEEPNSPDSHPQGAQPDSISGKQQIVRSHINDKRPGTSHSRDCKTQINKTKIEQAKNESEQILAQEEAKYGSDNDNEVPKISHAKAQSSNRNSKEFVIKEGRKRSAHLGASANGDNNFVSFHPYEVADPEHIKQAKKNSQNLRYSGDTKIAQKKVSSKSFMINPRKNVAQSKQIQKDAIKSSTSKASKAQLQGLNDKIKLLQSKLQQVEKRQLQLSNIELMKFKGSEGDRQHNDKLGESKASSIIEHRHHQSGQEKIGRSGARINTPSRKSYSIHPSPKIADLKQKQSMGSQEHSEGGRRQKIFDLVVRKKKLNMSSSIYNYNYSEDLQKKREEESKVSEKDKMSNEIGQLKKVIRELKLQRIKHEAIIEQFEKLQKEKYRQEAEEEIVKRKLQEIKEKQKQDRKKTEDLEHEDNQSVNNRNKDLREIKKESSQKKRTEQELWKQKKHNLNPTNSIKRDSSKKLRIETEAIESRVQAAKPKAVNNPQSPVPKEYHPKSLSRRGIIVRQVLNSSTDQTLRSYAPSTDNKHSRVLNDLEPPSPLSTGRKIFELEFVQAQKEESVASQQLEINVPEIDVEAFPVPALPQPPTPDINQSDLLKLAKEVCDLFGLKMEKDEHLYMKKYKNCIIFKTPDVKKTIVWHYSGKFYIGGWEQTQQGEGRKHGEGFQYVPSKHYYKGQFLDGKKNGSGAIIMENGTIYQGQWQKGQKNGQGKQLDRVSGLSYEGEWKNGKKDGKGVQKVSDKQFYDGTFVKSIKHGFGLELFANGDLYRGQYKNGRFHGKGKYVWANGSSYDGSFVQGKRQGYGRWKLCKKGGDVYVGGYKQDKKSGNGRYTWANGCTYDGSFLNDLKHGQGRVIYSDGKEMKGYWQNGKITEIDNQDELLQSGSRNASVIRPNIGTVVETPSKALQSSRFVHNV